MDDSLRIKREILDRLLEEARANPHIECCGLLAGRGGVISVALPATNALQSGKAYEIAPEELFELIRRMRSEGLQHLGIYHSHLTSDNTPSSTDIELAFYPDVSYLIVSPHAVTPRPIRAFRISEGRAHERALEIV
jgi:[CysO sulfur-carrier protein]-S-L-cysteine hydrolase